MNLIRRISETLEREKRENKKSGTLEGKQLCLATKREVRRVFCARQPLYLLFFQRQMLHANQFDEFKLPSGIESLLQDFDDVILTRSGSLDTGYGDLDDATSSEGR